MVVHTMGKPCEMDAIMDIARRHDLKVIEDACEAHGAVYRDRVVGSIGDMGTFSFYAAHVVVCGEGRKFISALVVPNRQLLVEYAQGHRIRCRDYAGLLRNEEVKEFVGSEIERLSDDLAPYEQIKAFALLPDGFSMENGLLTHTFKPRRKEILERYRQEIENLYAAEKH